MATLDIYTNDDKRGWLNLLKLKPIMDLKELYLKKGNDERIKGFLLTVTSPFEIDMGVKERMLDELVEILYKEERQGL